MKLSKIIIAYAFVLFLAGCGASSAQRNNMAVQGSLVGSGQQYDNSLKSNMTVIEVSGGKKTNPLWTSEIDNPEFKGALEDSLKTAGLLGDSATAKYQLKAELLKVKNPPFGFDMTVTTEIKYLLTESAGGKEIINKTITASYTAKVGDAFVAVKRLRLANEGSAKMNISEFLKELSNLKIGANQVTVTA